MADIDYIDYGLMTEDDKGGVYALLTESFVREAPLCRALQFEVPRDTEVWITQLIDDCWTNGFGIIATDKLTGQIVGVRLCKVVKKNASVTAAVLPQIGDSVKNVIVLNFLMRLYAGVDILKAYGVEDYVHFKVLNVRRDYGRRGIARRLVDEATKVARGLGYRLFIVEVTGNYSIRLYEKLGFDVLNTIMYDDYKDVNGERIFGDTGEHQMAKLMGMLYD